MLYEKQGVCKDPLLFLTFREGESDGWTGEADEGGRGGAAGGNGARGGSLLRGSSVDVARGQGGRPRRPRVLLHGRLGGVTGDRKSTRLNSSHANISYAVFCLNKKHNS